MSSLRKLRTELKKHANPTKAKILQRFFKTGKGEYAEGDLFLGITVPESRAIAKKFSSLSRTDIESLLRSKIHEERLVAILILVHIFKTQKEKQEEIVNFYLKNTKNINNWDLVDLSADKILSPYLEHRERDILYTLAQSQNIWERRIAIISTFHFIRQNKFIDTLAISRILLKDNHDLIHKAIGWMLREVGKRNQNTLENFLKQHYQSIPRTTLRYAIEHFPEQERQSYLKGNPPPFYPEPILISF